MKKERKPRAKTIPCAACGELFSSHGIHLHRERCQGKETEASAPAEPKPDEEAARGAGRERDSGGFIFRD